MCVLFQLHCSRHYHAKLVPVRGTFRGPNFEYRSSLMSRNQWVWLFVYIFVFTLYLAVIALLTQLPK